MTRIICVSNRVSLPDPQTGEIKAGGLAVGVKAALECAGGGLWIGWDGSVFNPDAGQKRKENTIEQDSISFLTFPLSQKEYDGYYKAMANERLWPLMHELGEHIEDRRGTFEMYRRVNKLFARMMKPHLRPGDIIWVHDYHLMLLGQELRALGVKNKIAYFHHIPMPHFDFIQGTYVPKVLKQRFYQLIKALFSFDLVGLQSFRDFKNLRSCIGHEAVLPPRYKSVPVTYDAYKTHIGVFPISVETGALMRKARRSAQEFSEIRHESEEYKIIIGAERLDYTKGLTERLEGFSEFLTQNPEYQNRVIYHQITPLSRSDIEEYQAIIEQTRETVERIQQEFGDANWRPISYTEECVPRDRLFDGFRHSDVGLVTPLIDGQNLVAKEYLAAQDPLDPGMLVLSRNAGAAEELESLGALCVDPNNPADIAQKIEMALGMELGERRECYRRAVTHLYRYDINFWAESFISEVREIESAEENFSASGILLSGCADLN